MAVIGINEGHAATVAIADKGNIIWASAEERISRKKNDSGFPHAALAEGLKQCGMSHGMITAAASALIDALTVDLKVKRLTRFDVADYVREMRGYWKPKLLEGKQEVADAFWDALMQEPRFNKKDEEPYDFSFMAHTPREKWDHAFKHERARVMSAATNLPSEAVSFMRHHRTHAAYAYYGSSVDKTKRVAVVTADGWGDGENATISLGENGALTKVHGTAMNHIARMYRYITLLLGMKPFEHEYKVMGLAPYARPYVAEPAYRVFKETLAVKGLDFVWKEKPSDMYFYFRDRLEGMRFDGIAGGLQRFCDELTVEWLTNILNHLNVDTLCYSGGLSMNIKTNMAIAQIPRLKELHIPGTGGDESTAIGAAYLLALDEGHTPKPLTHLYLGHAITDDEIETILRRADNSFDVKRSVTAAEVAALLAKDLVIARCAGRMEFGARALGNRSILCNPRNPKNLERVNEQIKFRDFWMPFTPSILDYRTSDYLINPKKIESRFMTIGFETTAKAKEDLPAALHPADHTARPQFVTKDANPAYYELIQEFEKLTGVGALLNTSFNLHGEPIVRNAQDAWHTFIDSGLDGLLLNDTLILKRSL